MYLSRLHGSAIVSICLLALAGCGGESEQSTPVTPQQPTATPPSSDVPPPLSPPPAAPPPAPTPSDEWVPAPPLDASRNWTEDASRNYYNAALRLGWKQELGSWTDAADTPQGDQPFASVSLADKNAETVVEWDVTELVQKYGADFLIRRTGGTNAKFHSREATSGQPQLIVTKRGKTVVLPSLADTHLAASTHQSQGASVALSSSSTMLLRFDAGADAGISKAVLKMTSYEQYGQQTLEIYRPDATPKFPQPLPVEYGTDDDVVLRVTGADWKQSDMGGFRSDRMKINADGSLTVSVPTGSDTGSTLGYAIPRTSRQSAMFARTIMKVHKDWTATTGGKFPGLSNTGMADNRANRCGWGGRLADGTCWSARTNRSGVVPGTPFADTHLALGDYIYRVNHATFNGDGKPFALPIEKEKIFVLDQMVKLNSIDPDGTANNDGEVAYWLNGVLVNRFTGIVFRDNTSVDTLPSEYWLDVYVGGTGYKAPSPHSVTFYEAAVTTKLLPFDRNIIDRLDH